MLGHDPRYFDGSRGGLSGNGGGGLLATSCPLYLLICCCTWWCSPWGVTDKSLLSHRLLGRCVPRIPAIPLAGGSIVARKEFYSLSLSLPSFRSRCRTLSPSHFRGNSLTSDDCQSRPCITARRSLLCICIFSCFSLCLVFRPHKKKKKKWRVLRRHPTKKGNSSFCCVLKPDEKKYYTEGERKKKKTEQFIFI